MERLAGELVQQFVNLKLKGLYTAPSDFAGVPDGALDIANDIVIDEESLAEPRRGFIKVTGNLPASNDRVNNFTSYQTKQIIAYTSTKLAYYAGSSWTTYSGTYAPPDATLSLVRFMEANKNLYISTSAGVYKLDVYTGTPAFAGIPKGLDLQLSLTGATGYLTTNTAATVTGTTTNASANLTVLSSTTGITVGQYVSGSGVTAGTTVSSITASATVLITTGNITAGSTSMTNVPTNSGIAANVLITGTGLQTGTRVSSISGAGPYTVTLSLAAVATTTGVTVTFASDPVVVMSANASASASVTLTFSEGSEVGYRLLWGIKDANNNVILGAPSQFTSITNNTGHTSDVQFTSSIPSGITTSHFYQVYRSSATASDSITPLDDEQLVYESNPSSSDISNGYVQVTDSTPDSLKGAFLYTGTSQEGIAQANNPPPFCKDFCSFKNYSFYANTKTKQRKQLTILSTVASTGITSGDTLVIGGITFTADSTETASTGHFKVFTAGTPAQNIADTTNSLIKVINRYATNTVTYAYLLSGPTDLPGQILLEERGTGGSAFVLTASAHGSAYNPALPTSGTTISSAQTTYLNGIAISKEGLPESVPEINLLFVGSASKEILRIIPLRDYIIVLKQDGIFRISGQTITNFSANPFDTTSNLLAPNSAVSLNNEVWGLFDQGVCSVNDSGVNVKSRAIEDVIKGLISNALSTITTVAFGIDYQTDRKYILALPSASGDTFSNQQYVFSTFTNVWTRWTRSCTAGFIDPTVDKLYLGNGAAQTVSVERKSNTYTDYVDEDISVTISSSSGLTVTLASATGVSVGDVLYLSSSVFSLITAVNLITNVVTVEDTRTWVNGAATVLPGISGQIQWKPVVAGNPFFVRHYQEGSIAFKKRRFSTGTISIYTDVDQSFEDTTLLGDGVGAGGWGLFVWGSGGWGGVLRPRSKRYLVPQSKQMAAQLSVKITIRNGYSLWSIQGMSLSYENVNQEIA